MDERIELLRDHVEALNDAGVRRTTFFRRVAESLKRTRGQPAPVRRAEAFAHLLDNVEQVVLPHELLAGSILGMWPLAEGLPSYQERRREAMAALDDYLQRKRKGQITRSTEKATRWALMARDHYDSNLPYEELQRLIGGMKEHFADVDDLTDAEIGRELERHFQFDYGEARELMRELPWAVANHLDLNYRRVVNRGLGDIRREISERLQGAENEEKRTFYRSTLIAVEAAIRFVERYTRTLEAKADGPDASAGRAEELREMAAVCRNVATGRPESFRQALQLLWLVHVMANIGGGSALSFARFDQYMYPFYRRDIENGRLSREQAAVLISCMWLKVNEPKMRTVQSLCLGGTTPQGQDAANELTELCLEVCAQCEKPYPNTSVRISNQSPEWLLDRAVETMKLGFGQPMVLNDETWIPNFQRLGYPPRAARDYYNMGCVEMMIQGGCPNWAGCGGVDFPGLLELVFRDGRENMAAQSGIPTGSLDSLETFEHFMQAYLAQLRHQLGKLRASAERRIEEGRGRYFDPFASALIDDCLQKGLDVFQGGSRYEPIRAVSGYGLGTAADSLSAVRKFVYEEGRVSLQEMREALEADFEGHSELRAMLDGRTPCWGNNEDGVDGIARRVFSAYADTVHGYNDGSMPGTFVTSVFSYTRHVRAGEVIAATPNGRRRGAPVSETIGPSQGKDAKGPTALIRSVTKLDPSHITGASALNVKFSAGLLAGSEGSAALRSLIRTYLDLGGVQIQVNFVDPAELRDAQEHPDQHRNLVVRVAGFCEYFRNLDRQLQDEIISRTAHGT